MKRLVLITAAAFSAAPSFGQNVQPAMSLVSSAGEEAVFNITEREPHKTPVLYASALLFNNTGFSGRTGSSAGAGADVQLTLENKLKLNAYYMQGLLCLSPYMDRQYRNGEASAAWYFTGTEAEVEKNVRMKSTDNPEVQVFAVPAKALRQAGFRAGYAFSGTPLNTYTPSNLSSRSGQASYVTTSSFTAGFTFTESSCFQLSSNDYGTRLHSVKNTFYADAMLASSIDAQFNVFPAGSENAPAHEYARYGGRVGYERASILKRSGLGSFYRLEAGYSPGLKDHDAGVYMKFHAGVTLGKKL